MDPAAPRRAVRPRRASAIARGWGCPSRRCTVTVPAPPPPRTPPPPPAAPPTARTGSPPSPTPPRAPVLTRAVQLAAARPDRTEPELRIALAAPGLSDGTAAAALLRALAALWPDAASVPLLTPDPRQLPQLQHLPAATHRTAAVEHPCPPAAQALWLHEHAQVTWAAGHLVAADDQRSILGRLVRRQLAAVGRLDVPQLLAGARRAHPPPTPAGAITATRFRLQQAQAAVGGAVHAAPRPT